MRGGLTPTLEGHSDLMVDVCRRRALGERDVIERLHLPRLEAGGVDVQVLVVGGDVPLFAGDLAPDALDEALRALDAFWVEEEAGSFSAVLSAGDLDRAGDGSVSFLLHLEGGRPLRGDLALLRTLVRLGVRSVGLTWNRGNELADGCMDARGAGLSDVGAAAVREMNRLGVVVDVSHLAERGVFDVLEASSSPVVASHSNARALCDHPRNLTDAQVEAIAAAGGVVGVCFYPSFVAAHERPTLEDVLDHVDHLVRLVGAEHVGVGPDWVGFLDEQMLASAGMAPIRAEMTRPFPLGLEDVTRLGALREGLERRGYGDEDVDAIMGGSFLRVLRQVLPV